MESATHQDQAQELQQQQQQQQPELQNQGAQANSSLQALTEVVTKAALEAMTSKFKDWGEITVGQITANMKEAVRDNLQDVSDRAAKRLKMDNPDLQKAGCIDQYQHNTEVMKCIEKAAASILKGDGEAGITSLNKGKQLIKNRQKLVQLADREEKGWKVVKEYVKDNLASDSDDEKQISRARRNAVQKEKEEWRKKSFRRNTRAQPTTFASYRNLARPRFDTQANYSYQQPKYHRQDYRQNDYRQQSTRSDYRRNKYDRECYGCGRRGHLYYDCPQSNNRY